MSAVCLASALLYFLYPPQVACSPWSSDWAWRAWKDGYEQQVAYATWQATVERAYQALSAPYGKCQASHPQISFNRRETCSIAALSKRCSPADDCLVQCMATGAGRVVGGGCAHICFSDKFDLSRYRSPPGEDACWNLPLAPGEPGQSKSESEPAAH